MLEKRLRFPDMDCGFSVGINMQPGGGLMKKGGRKETLPNEAPDHLIQGGEKKEFMNTREIAEFLDLNEKMIYALIAEKGLPATKVTGKWLFPTRLVKQWLENETINYPKEGNPLPPYHGLLIVCGSNDILLDKTIALFNKIYPENVAVFGNLGSMGGIRALRRGFCHIASSHLMEAGGGEYNFRFAENELGHLPAIVNFCMREQGLLIARGNPKTITGIKDLAREDVTIVNRSVGTGTRLLLDQELLKLGLAGDRINGYGREVQRHVDVGMEIIAGRVDAGLAIKAAATVLGLDFIPLRWERFDLLITRERFFDEGVQLFMGVLHDARFRELLLTLDGYDLGICGKMVFPQESSKEK